MPKPALPPWLHEPAGVLLGTRTKVAVLRILSGTGSPLSQREVARRARLTPRSVGVALDDLVATGVVHRHLGGREHLLTLNAGHALAPTLRALFVADTNYFAALRQALAAVAGVDKGSGLVSVAVFGSVARAQEAPASDLDLLILGRTPSMAERWRSRYLEAASDIQERFGTRVNPVAYALPEARRRWARRLPPFPDLMQDAIVVVGSPLQGVLEP